MRPCPRNTCLGRWSLSLGDRAGMERALDWEPGSLGFSCSTNANYMGGVSFLDADPLFWKMERANFDHLSGMW